MTERLYRPGMVPQSAAAECMNARPNFGLGDPILDRQRPYETMESDGHDAMRRKIRRRAAACGIRGFGPAERFIAAPPSWWDQPRPPISPIAALEAAEGVVNPDAWLHAFMAESTSKRHHRLPLLYVVLIPCARDHLAHVGRKPSAAAPLEHLIETRAA